MPPASLRPPRLAVSLVALVATGCGARTLLRDAPDAGPTVDVAPGVDAPSVDAPLPPPGDAPVPSACERAAPIAAAAVIADQDTAGLVGTAPTCPAAGFLGGAPLWYRVVVPSRQTLTVTATAIATGEPLMRAPVVRLFDTCADAACVGGSNVSTDGRTVSARSTNDTAADRAVIVAVSSVAPGVRQRFTLVTALSAVPANVTCGGATPVADGASLAAQEPSSGVDTQAPCPGQMGVRTLPARFYTAVVPPGASVFATATAEGPARSQPHVRIIPDCGANTCLAASTPAGGAATASYFNDGALPRRVVITLGAQPNLTADRYTMTFRIRAPAANSVCASATRVTSGTVLRGENLADGRTPSPWCGNSPRAGALYYAVRVGAGEALVARATNPAADFPFPTLRLSDRCDSTMCLGSSTSSGGATPGGQLSYLNTTGAPQDVVLAVDAGAFDVAAFRYDLAISTALPPYTVSRTAVACDDLTAGEVIAGAVGDDVGTPAIALPVSFSFFGAPVAAWSVSTNGYLQVWPSLAGMSGGALGGAALPSPDAPPNMIAAFWDDLEVRPAERMDVRWQTVAAPARHLTVQWTDVGFCCGGAPPDRVRFQAKLFEGTGVIELHYCSQRGGERARGSAATIGVQDAAGVRGVSVLSRSATIDAMTAFRLAPTP